MARCLAGALLLPLFAGCASEQESKVAASESKMTLGGLDFCPQRPVKRRDMARWLLRMKHGRDYTPPASRGIFKDVPRGSADEPWIEQLFAEGITRGCSAEGDKYCPDEDVPREQMAAFIIRLTHGADFSRVGTGRFTDVTGGSEIFEGYIEQLADDGVTRGCTETNFCPRETVARDQMAAFLLRAIHPGSDPAGTGMFGDVPQWSVLGGRAEQAVREGIMEPCDTWDWTGRMDAFTVPSATLRPTPSYGIVNAPQWKAYARDHVRDQCGGEYMVHAAVDVGAVGWDSIEVKRVTYFYPGSAVYATAPQAFATIASNGGPSIWSHNGVIVPDTNGTPFQTFEVNQTFYGVRADQGDGLVLYHWVQPDANYGPYTADWGKYTCGMWVKTLLQVE